MFHGAHQRPWYRPQVNGDASLFGLVGPQHFTRPDEAQHGDDAAAAVPGEVGICLFVVCFVLCCCCVFVGVHVTHQTWPVWGWRVLILQAFLHSDPRIATAVALPPQQGVLKCVTVPHTRACVASLQRASHPGLLACLLACCCSHNVPLPTSQTRVPRGVYQSIGGVFVQHRPSDRVAVV